MELKNALYEADHYLAQYQRDIDRRHEKMVKMLRKIDQSEGIDFFSMSYKSFGLHVMADNSVQARVSTIFISIFRRKWLAKLLVDT